MSKHRSGVTILESSYQTTVLEAGCDEAGRGALAGPVFAAAVILPDGFEHPKLRDSKRMSKRDRELLRGVIESRAVAWAVAEVDQKRVDEVNILNASFEAMNRALEALEVEPGMIVVDGNGFKTELSIPYKCVVGGDDIFANIAAASVLAKTHRDQKMEQLAQEHPEYGWEHNRGYPTKRHKEAIRQFGTTKYHRKSFKLE